MSIKVFKLLFMIAAVIGFASCKDDDNNNNGGTSTEIVTYNLTTNATVDDSKVAQRADFASGKQLAALNIFYSREVGHLDYNGSSFTGQLASITSTVSIGYFYPASAVTQEKSSTTAVLVDCSRQDGVNVETYLAGKSTATLNGTNATSNVKLSAVNAAAILEFENNGAPINGITHVELYAASGNLYSRGYFELSGLNFSSQSASNISIINSGLNGKARIAMIPCKNVRLGATVITADNKAYNCELPTSTTIEAGKEYTFKFNCSEVTGKAKVGDYFYSDFTHSSEYDDTKTCIGIVYALSDHEGSKINSSLEASSHGRIVSLCDAGKSAWVYSSSQVQDIAGIANYSNVDGNNAQGYLPISFDSTPSYVSDADVKILASVKDGKMDQWPSAGALSDFAGIDNTACIDSVANKFPAAYSAIHFEKGGSRWHLPSAGELALIYSLNKAGKISSQEGFASLDEFGYWTSSEYDANKAWVLQAFNGRLFPNYKTSSYLVRPVMTF